MTKAKDPKPPRPKRAGPANKTNPTTGGFQISDELWAVLEPLIPKRVNTHRFGGGRPPGSRPHLRQRHLLRVAHRLPVEGLGRHGDLFRVHRAPALSGVGCRWGVPGVVAGGTGTLRRTAGSGLELAEYGRGHDQVAPGWGKKLAPTPPTEVSEASSAAC